MSRPSLNLALIAALGLAAATPAAAQMAMPQIGDPALPTDQFLQEAGQSDQFEIQEGQLAQSMGKSAKVKSFGAQMIKDHTKSTAMIQAAVKKAGMTPPPPPPLKPEQQQMLDKTRGMTGADFDAGYVSDQLMSHQAALALMTNYAKSGESAPIKAAAAKIVPVVQMHLKMLQSMQGSMGGGMKHSM